MTNLTDEVTQLIDELMKSNDRTFAAERMLAAVGLLRHLFALLNARKDTSRNKELLRLMGRLTIRAGELLDDRSTTHQMLVELEAEANKTCAAMAGL
jgi:hypothetical protein